MPSRLSTCVTLFCALMFIVAGTAAVLAASERISPQPSDSRSTSGGNLLIHSGDRVHAFTVEFARTPAEKARGLMFREQLAPDAGMIFEMRPPRIASMWMKNTPLPLDMLFIDESGRIIKIVSNTEPYSLKSISSGAPVSAVLELNGGTADRLGIKTGDSVEHHLFNKGAE